LPYSSQSKAYSPKSEEAAARCPGRKIFSSSSAGWQSILLQTYEQHGAVELYENWSSEDHLLLLYMSGEKQMNSRVARSWRKSVSRAGVSASVAPHVESQFRWNVTSSGGAQMMKLFIPQVFFAEAREEYRRAGLTTSGGLPDFVGFEDPVVFSLGKSLGAQLVQGMPDLCAEAGARALATYLLAKANHWSEATLNRNPGFSLPERQFARVLEFMKHSLSNQISLHDLAKEAGMSEFHFARVFKKRFGSSPHRYLTRLRMDHAHFLLSETDSSVGEVALACGYTHHGHFAAAFRSQFALAPGRLRMSDSASKR
jgi:AraC family transcriptional regulator